ncbi:hypothetical protein AB0395_03765 [Streptosporangium sp. NPDC051023]|uniref:hypothetical protein n=1 Tax=Streptosporangium sp. NPDC051023 TaxID=3155410 RepID=UPI00344E430A
MWRQADSRGHIRQRDRSVRQRRHRREQTGIKFVGRPGTGVANVAFVEMAQFGCDGDPGTVTPAQPIGHHALRLDEEHPKVRRREHPMPHHGRHNERGRLVTAAVGVHHGHLARGGDGDLKGGVPVKRAVHRRALIEGVARADDEIRHQPLAVSFVIGHGGTLIGPISSLRG